MVVKAKYLDNVNSELPFMLDGEIPALQIALNPDELGHYLRRVLPSEWGFVQDIKIQVLQRHRRRRWTVDISLETTTGKHGLIGKIHATGREDVYRAMKQLSQSGFGPEDEFSIPQPLAYISELHLFLQEKIEGQLATDIFTMGNEDEKIRAAERCALWLARFHTQAPLVGQKFVLTDEMIDIWVRRLVHPIKSLEEKALQLAQRLRVVAPIFSNAETCFCHGGYWHEQIIFPEDRVVTCDWDNHCLAHPGRDVARFIIELQQLALRLYGSSSKLDDLIQVFYKVYTTTSEFDVGRSVPFYKAVVCLKRAKYHLRRDGCGPEQAEAMLDEGLRSLAEEA